MIGILAYGSLIDNPGPEIKPLIADEIETTTPFPVEFARKSETRDCGPTLIPYKDGSSVQAKVFVLRGEVSESDAIDMLYRRETRNEETDRRYDPPSQPNENTVLVEQLTDFEGLDVVLYTNIGDNISDPNPQRLAKLAIDSAKSKAGARGKDGIAYLIDARRNGIETPLMSDYRREILRRTAKESLEDARRALVNEKDA